MGNLLRKGVKTERLFEKKRKKFLLFTPKKTVHGTFENAPPQQQQQQEGEEQRFPLPDLSASPQIKRKRNRWFQRWIYPCSIAFYTARFSKTIMRRYVIFLEKVDCFTNTQKSLSISGFFLGRFIFSFSGNVGGGGKGGETGGIEKALLLLGRSKRREGAECSFFYFYSEQNKKNACFSLPPSKGLG